MQPTGRMLEILYRVMSVWTSDLLPRYLTMYIKHSKSDKKCTLLGTLMPKFLQGLFPVIQDLSPIVLVYWQISWLSILFMK